MISYNMVRSASFLSDCLPPYTVSFVFPIQLGILLFYRDDPLFSCCISSCISSNSDNFFSASR